MIVETLDQWTYIAVFILAAIPWIELAVIVPIGILMGLSPIPVAILGFIGNWLTVFLLIVLFERWNRWRAARRAAKGEEQENGSKRSKRAGRIWERYGLPGLAIIGPLITGSHIAAAVAMAFKAPKGWVTIWMTISLAFWTIVLAIVAYYGFDALGIIQTDFFERGE